MNDVCTDEATNIQEAVERNLKDADDVTAAKRGCYGGITA